MVTLVLGSHRAASPARNLQPEHQLCGASRLRVSKGSVIYTERWS